MKATDKKEQLLAEQTALLAIVRAGLWEQPVTDRSAFPLSDSQWETVFRLARQQTVTGLAFQGVSQLPDELMPPDLLLKRWAAAAAAIERKNRKMNAVLDNVCTVFRGIGLRPVLQKGQGIARFYEKPLLRVCGDIDLYFPDGNDREKAIAHLRSCRIPFEKQADGGIAYVYQGIEVEHHNRLLDLYNPLLQSYANKLQRIYGYRPIALRTDSTASIATPSPFLDLLLQNLHILKHTLGRGVGLRQLCDMARSCYRLHAEINPAEMEAACHRLGIHRWSRLLHAFLTDYLGLPPECLPYPAVAPSAQPLAEIVWKGGNFGQYNTNLQAKAGAWQHKRQTAFSFLHNMRFAFHYAPKEASSLFLQLMKGQFKC